MQKNTVKVVGAGLGRTGTTSLTKALGQLLDTHCYHMFEFMKHPEHITFWRQAAAVGDTDWKALFANYGAVVDWPVASYWYEVSQAYPDAIILLSVREPESWWGSANATIFKRMRESRPNPILDVVKQVFESRFTLDLGNRDACIAAFEAHYADVRARAPADRLLEWSPGDGWGPICEKLGVPVPTQPFPHANSREEFLKDGP